MAVLTLDVGGTPITVPCQRGGHAAPRAVGQRTYGSNGQEQSSIRAELMVVPVVLAPLPTATVRTIRTLFALGNQVTCEGDIFNRPGEQIICSGKITDELRETADTWVVNLTLYEVGNLTTGVVSPEITIFILTGALSPDAGGDPDVYVTTPDSPYVGDVTTQIETFDGIPLTGSTQDSADPEVSWLSVPLAAGWISGPMSIQVLIAQPPASYANPNSSQARIYHVRGGVNIAGPFSTNFGAAYLGGDLVTITTTTSVSLTLEDGDRLLVEIWSRIKLQEEQIDSGARQTLFFGTNPGGSPGSLFFVPGIVASL